MGGRRLAQRRRGHRAAGRRRPRLGRRPGHRRRSSGTADARFFGTLPEDGPPLTVAESINRTLAELLAADPSVLVFGEDVGAKGGVYGVTRGLAGTAGSDRVFDTAARRADDPRTRPRHGRLRHVADPGGPVPRLRAQRHRPTPWRGSDVVLLLHRAVRQPDGRAHRRLRLPEGLRWSLPQRQRPRWSSRPPRCRRRLAGDRHRRRGDAADVRRSGEDRRNRVPLRRADRPVPHARPARRRRRGLAVAVRRARGVVTDARSDRQRPTSPATATTS